jgi:putative transposase
MTRKPVVAGSGLLRAARHSVPGEAYLVTTNTFSRWPWFSDWRMGAVVAREIGRIEAEGFVENLAFVIMPDHVHWLFFLESGDLAAIMRKLKGRSSRVIHKAYGPPGGRLWAPGYHDHMVRGQISLRALARYLVANPLRAGLVQDLRHYPLWDAVWLDDRTGADDLMD